MKPTPEILEDLKRLGEFLWKIIVVISARGLDILFKTVYNIPFKRILEICLYTFEGFCRIFDALLLRLGVGHIVASHPFTSAMVLMILSLSPGAPFMIILYPVVGILELFFMGILACIGFRKSGVKRGSLAASFQSENYGPLTPAKSFFAFSQSYTVRPSQSESTRMVSKVVSAFGSSNPFWRAVGEILRGIAVMIFYSYIFKLYPTPDILTFLETLLTFFSETRQGHLVLNE